MLRHNFCSCIIERQSNFYRENKKVVKYKKLNLLNCSLIVIYYFDHGNLMLVIIFNQGNIFSVSLPFVLTFFFFTIVLLIRKP